MAPCLLIILYHMYNDTNMQ